MKGKKLLLLPAIMLATSGLSSCSALCSVTWLNWDNSILEYDEHVFPFEFHKYDGKTPTREKDAQYTYDFAGWEPVRASKVFPKRVIKRDTVYRATYNSAIRSYTIVFKDAEGKVLNTQVKNYGEYPQFTPQNYSTVSHDYEFKGWDKPLAKVTEDATYTANFKSTLRSYNVTWLDYAGKPLRTDSVNYDVTPFYGKVDPERTSDEPDVYRWDFKGWINTSTNEDGLKPVTGDVTYQALYERHDYLYFDMYYLFYDYDDDYWFYYEGPEVETLVRENTDLVLPTYVEGFDISWFLDENYEKPVEVAKDVYDTMIFYGKIVDYHKFFITYDLDGGTLVNHNPGSITYYDAVHLNEPQKKGYDFDGWYDQNGNKIENNFLSNVYSDLQLTAHYTAHKWNINFDCTGCSEQFDPILNVAYDSEFDLPVAQKNGYKFLGWKEAGATEYFSSPLKVDHEVTLYPEFEIINYTITYQLKFDETCDTTGHTSYNVEHLDDALPIPEKIGYEFEGWEIVKPTTLKGQVIEKLSDVLDSDSYLSNITIKPTWSPISVNVSFDFAGGTKEFSVSFKDGNDILQKETVAYGVNEVGFYVPEDKEGYQFGGWYGWPLDPITEDIELQAKWIHLYHNAQTGEEYTSCKLGEETELFLHNLNGEYCQFTSLVEQDVVISTSGELDLLINTISVIDSGISDDDLNFWVKIHVLAGISYPFRVFGATNTDGKVIVKIQGDENVDQIPTTTITAALDDTLPSFDTKYDEALPDLIAPVKAGYEFAGWFVGDTEYKSGDQIKEAQDFTLVAHWTELPDA